MQHHSYRTMPPLLLLSRRRALDTKAAKPVPPSHNIPPHSRCPTTGAQSARRSSVLARTVASPSRQPATFTSISLDQHIPAGSSSALPASSYSRRDTPYSLIWSRPAVGARSDTALITLRCCGSLQLACWVQVATSVTARSDTSCLKTRVGSGLRTLGDGSPRLRER